MRLDDPGAVALGLRESGYIWRRPGQVDWEPGIPSLMSFIRHTAGRTDPDTRIRAPRDPVRRSHPL